MTVIGTKKFWKPAPGASASQTENQILKNTGYFNIQLFSFNYMSKGDFFQNTFGGKNNIALSTTLKFDSGTTSIEAASIQDVRKVPTGNNFNQGLQRNIAVKVPANADAISLEVKITEVKTDNLQTKFDMLNKPEFQAGLQLAPVVVGQLITVTSLVKKLFTDSDPKAQLEASFAGIISNESEASPVQNGKLTKGMLIIIATNDGPDFTGSDETKFSLKGDQLYYNNKVVENTYVLFNITFEALKGISEKSNWSRRYNDALSYLDKIVALEDKTEIEKIFKDSKDMWIEANALLNADDSYIDGEKSSIKALMITKIREKYNKLTKPEISAPALSTDQILQGISGTTNFDTLKTALPATGSLFSQPQGTTPDANYTDFKSWISGSEINNTQLFKSLTADSKTYLSELKDNNLLSDLKNNKNLFF
ncbi:hypothetical protein [Flavobacterium sp.]|uniref:hypothetical protein n=1 Tax=Flavobacterium sp. TaxID=239 RepID=UPI0031D4DBB7